MADSTGRVDKVVRLIGVSEHTWEDAARSAVAEAAKTIRQLSNARVVDLDVRVMADGALHYRVQLEVSFRVDRHRTTPTGHPIVVRRLLVVGNETLRRSTLSRAITSRRLQSPLEVHVVVPRSARPLGPLVLGDPSAGVLIAEAQLAETEVAAEQAAHDRLEEFLRLLERLDIAATGELGSSNPVHAVQQVLARADFDEIIFATLPRSISRWIRMDALSRLQRITAIPVTHVEAEDT